MAKGNPIEVDGLADDWISRDFPILAKDDSNPVRHVVQGGRLTRLHDHHRQSPIDLKNGVFGLGRFFADHSRERGCTFRHFFSVEFFAWGSFSLL